MTNYEQNAVLRRGPAGRYETLVRDERLLASSVPVGDGPDLGLLGERLDQARPTLPVAPTTTTIKYIALYDSIIIICTPEGGDEPSPPARNAKNGHVGGVVLSIIEAFVGPIANPGLILGVAARRRIDRLRADALHELVFARGGDGRGLATTAKVLAIVDLVG